MDGIKDWIGSHKKLSIAILVTIVILIIMIIVFAVMGREGYTGNPLAKLMTWDSGGKLRRSGMVFSSTNQGEGMTATRSGPWYTGPWQANSDLSSNLNNRQYDMRSEANASKTESYSGNQFKADDKLGQHKLIQNLY
jgi:hypothetical protein